MKRRNKIPSSMIAFPVFTDSISFESKLKPPIIIPMMMLPDIDRLVIGMRQIDRSLQ